MDSWKQSREVKSEERRSIRESVESWERKYTHARNVRKVPNCCVFSMICGSGWSKSRLGKAAGAEVAVQQSENGTLLWREAHCQVKHGGRGPIFEVQMSNNGTPLWHEAHLQVKICKNYIGAGPLLEVTVSKNRMPLRREAHLQVKMYKTLHVRASFWRYDEWKWHAAVWHAAVAPSCMESCICWIRIYMFGYYIYILWFSLRNSESSHS